MNAALKLRRPTLWLAWLASALLARPALTAEPVVDPPSRVARLSLIEGEVSLAPAGSEEWAEAVLNRPLTSGDRLWIETGGRAELQVGSAAIHLDERTSFGFVELGDDLLQMSLTGGTAAVRVQRLAASETVRIETPNASVLLRRPGEYTIEVDPQADNTIVRTRTGEAEIAGEHARHLVGAGQEGTFSGLDTLRADVGPLSGRTAFEEWANERDRYRERSTSSRYVAREVIGYEDLDHHGEWVHEPRYGHVWRPLYVAHDWAPYRYGRWAWVGPWGWTWVDDARWGFAPFHYGRWAHVRQRWCWVPGPRHVRAIYAPALVGWIGSPSVSVSISLGHGIGWFPLAPHEVYVPHYRHTPRYIRHVNVSNTIIASHAHVTNIYAGRARPHRYRHRDVHGAVTAVHREHFVGGRPIAGHRMHVAEGELRQWRRDARPRGAEPVRHSILAGEARQPRFTSSAGADRAALIERRGDSPRARLPGSPKDRGDFHRPRPGAASSTARHSEIKRSGFSRPDASRSVPRSQAEPVYRQPRPDVMRAEERPRESIRRDHRQRPSTPRVIQAQPPSREVHRARDASRVAQPRRAEPAPRAESRHRAEQAPRSRDRSSRSSEHRSNRSPRASPKDR